MRQVILLSVSLFVADITCAPNVWYSPSSSNNTGVIPVWEIGSSQPLQWTTEWKTFSIYLTQNAAANSVGDFDSTILGMSHAIPSVCKRTTLIVRLPNSECIFDQWICVERDYQLRHPSRAPLSVDLARYRRSCSCHSKRHIQHCEPRLSVRFKQLLGCASTINLIDHRYLGQWPYAVCCFHSNLNQNYLCNGSDYHIYEYIPDHLGITDLYDKECCYW